MQQPDEPGLSLDEGADHRALVLADNEIAFPVPGLAAVAGFEGALMDGEHRLGEPRASAAGSLVRLSVITTRA